MKLWLPGMQCWFRQSELGQTGALSRVGFPPRSELVSRATRTGNKGCAPTLCPVQSQALVA